MNAYSNRFIVWIGICAAIAAPANASEYQACHHHEHHYAPIGIMGDHTHAAGDWMTSYRYMFMDMDGNRDGTSRKSTSDVLADYMVAPEDMSMEMHMVGAMYAPSDRLTLMVMAPYINMEMDHVTRMGAEFTTETSGLGDVKFTALYGWKQWGENKVIVNAGLSIPTGSFDEKDGTPMGRVRLPYPMQLGSGTFDLIPGMTYIGQGTQCSWGSRVGATIRLGENDNDYTLGNRYEGSTWVAHELNKIVSLSLRADLTRWENIDGADSRLSPGMVPTADPDRRAGTRLDVLGGIDIACAKNHRVAIEIGAPVYQDLDGPQLETDWLATAGWQKVW